MDKLIDRLAMRWVSEPVMLDLGHFHLSSVNSRGQSLIGYAMEAAATHSNQAVPVVRLSDPDRAYDDAAMAGANGIGAAVRVTSEDLDVDPDELNEDLDRILTLPTRNRNQVDLVVDPGVISEDVAVVGGARLVISVLRD